MSNGKSFLDKTLDLVLDSVSDLAQGTKARELYEEGKNKVNEVGTLAKTVLSISADKEELRRTFTEIGKLCYEQNKANPDACYGPLFDKIEALTAGIEEKQLIANTIKATITPKNPESAVDADFESINPDSQDVDVIEFGKTDN